MTEAITKEKDSCSVICVNNAKWQPGFSHTAANADTALSVAYKAVNFRLKHLRLSKENELQQYFRSADELLQDF